MPSNAWRVSSLKAPVHHPSCSAPLCSSRRIFGGSAPLPLRKGLLSSWNPISGTFMRPIGLGHLERARLKPCSCKLARPDGRPTVDRTQPRADHPKEASSCHSMVPLDQLSSPLSNDLERANDLLGQQSLPDSSFPSRHRCPISKLV